MYKLFKKNINSQNPSIKLIQKMQNIIFILKIYTYIYYLYYTNTFLLKN